MDLQEKSTIILAFRNEVVADVYSLAFEGIFSSHTISCSDAATASHALKKNPDACVVIESSIPGGPLHAFFENQASLAKRASVFVLGGDKTLLPKDSGAEKLHVEFLPENPEMKVVVEKVEAALKLAGSAQHYCKITLKSLLVRSDRLRCDVYIKLSGDKFVKVLHSNERFDDAEYERFRAKGVEFLFLPRSDFLGLMDDLLTKVAELNSAPEKISVEKAIDTKAAIFQTVHAAFDSEGFTPQLQKLTVASVNLAINTIKKNPKLGELLARLDSNRDSYLSWHSTAMSFLACKLATMLGWHSEATFYKLSLASMLHDLSLNSDKLSLIQTTEELKNAELTEKERVMVLRHTIEATRLVNSFDEIPGEVGFIVEQHHERQDGSGFPRGIDHKDISSISALFIITHDVVTEMYKAPPQNFNMVEFMNLREKEKRYTKGTFGQVFRALMGKIDEM